MKNVVIAKSLLPAVEKSGTLFGRGGLRLHPVDTSEEMLDLHRRIKADLIIAEFSQPVMSGAELCTAVRSEPGLRDVSFIIACEDSNISQAACRAAGANAVITKPLDPFALFSKVSELIIIPHRKDMRVLLSVSVEGKDEERPFFATSYNIRVSGMLLETTRELQVGSVMPAAAGTGPGQTNSTPRRLQNSQRCIRSDFGASWIPSGRTGLGE